MLSVVSPLPYLVSPEDGGVEDEHGAGRTGEHQLRGVAALGQVQQPWDDGNAFYNERWWLCFPRHKVGIVERR